MSRLDPLAERSVSFLFTRCQARLDGKDLVVAVPWSGVTARMASGDVLRWEEPRPVDRGVQVICAPGRHRRADRSEYPSEPAYTQSVEFRFRGAVWYGRIPLAEGWALCVQGTVRSLQGLPEAFAAGTAVLIEAPGRAAGTDDRIARHADGGGPVNGPHLPYP